MSADMIRRGFLRQLAALPLIGGSVTLIGQPKAVAEPVTRQLMFEYAQWLSWERIAAYRDIHAGFGWGGWADHEAGALECNASYSVAQHLHGSHGVPSRDLCESGLRSHAYRWHHGAQEASTRAALVLSTVGCDWRGAYLGGPQ